MTDTNELSFTLVEDQETSPEVPISAFQQDVEDAFARVEAIATDGDYDADATLDADNDEIGKRRHLFRFTGPRTAQRTLTLPQTEHEVGVWNDTTGGFSYIVDSVVSGTTSVEVPMGGIIWIKQDSTGNVFQVSGPTLIQQAGSNVGIPAAMNFTGGLTVTDNLDGTFDIDGGGAGGGGGGSGGAGFGAFDVIQTIECNGQATLDFGASSWAEYAEVRFVLSGVQLSADLRIQGRVSTNAGGAFVSTSDYNWTSGQHDETATSEDWTESAGADAQIEFGNISFDATSPAAIGGFISMTGHDASLMTGFSYMLNGNDTSAQHIRVIGSADYDETTVVNGFQLLLSGAGNFAAGTVTAVGMRKELTTGASGADQVLRTIVCNGQTTLDFGGEAEWADYVALKIYFSGVTISTDNRDVWGRVSTDGGATYVSTGTPYHWWYEAWDSNAGTANPDSAAANEILIAAFLGTTGNESMSFVLDIMGHDQPSSTSVLFRAGGINSGAFAWGDLGVGSYDSANIVDGFQLLLSDTGTFDGGTVTLVGVRKRPLPVANAAWEVIANKTVVNQTSLDVLETSDALWATYAEIRAVARIDSAPSAAGAIELLLSTDGSTFHASSAGDYQIAGKSQHADAGSETSDESTSATAITVLEEMEDAADGLAIVEINIIDPGNSVGHKPVLFRSAGLQNDANLEFTRGAGVLDVNTTSLKGLQLTNTAGNISASIVVEGKRRDSVRTGSSGKRLLNTIEFSGAANADLDSGFNDNHDDYEIEFKLALASDGQLHARMSHSSSFITTANYDWNFRTQDPGSSDVDTDAVGSTRFQLCEDTDGAASTSFIHGVIKVWRARDDDIHKNVSWQLFHANATATANMHVIGGGTLDDATTVIDGFQLLGRNTGDSGDVNINGWAKLWGLPKA